MKTKRYLLNRLLSGAALLMGTVTASAHIGYTGRDFGTVVPNAAPITISNQSVTSNFGWADGTDADFGDGHKLRYYRFNLAVPAYVTITFSGSTNGGAKDGSIKPGFSVFQGLAHLAPITNAPGSADHDGAPITLAYLASLGGVAKEGAFRALADWRVGGENQPGPVFDFDAADGLSTFVFKGYAVDGNASLFGSAPGVVGDNNADGTVTKSLFLPAGDYSIFVGGANYAGQFPTPDATSYGLTGTISAAAFTYAAGDPAEGGIGYQHQVTLGENSSGSFSGLVGAWSWEDNKLFGGVGQGTAPVGWTHTSNWAAVRLQKDTVLTVTMARDANVPQPTEEDPDAKADTTSMNPSMTLFRGLDNDGDDFHTYNNRGNIAWAEDIQYVDHVDNSTEETITRSWFLRAGDYTFALGSNAAADNLNKQGYRISFSTQSSGTVDPVPNTYLPPEYIGTGGIGYTYTVIAKVGDSGNFSNRVGAWSWEDSSLPSAPGQKSLGWTHTSNWLALKLEEEAYFSFTMESDNNVPWPSIEDPDRKADTSHMKPSFTLYRGWDNDGSDNHTYSNKGNVLWAEDIRYMDHVDNSSANKVTRTWRLPAGEYTLALGSNATADTLLEQGYKVSYQALTAGAVVTGDPAAGGIGYSRTISVGRGDSGSFSDHVGSWSWEDEGLDADEPVGWTHQSRWLAVHIKDPLTLNITMARDANVSWPSTENPGRLAPVDKMNPSFTLYRGWDNDGSDSHIYSNSGDIAWAEDISYVDHYGNSSLGVITRSYTLAPGYYTFALGSNAPADERDTNRQGFSFTWTTGNPVVISPAITQQPKGVELVEGKKTTLAVKATGPSLSYQWSHNGKAIEDGTSNTLVIGETTLSDAGNYTVEVRNAAGWVTSTAASVAVVAVPIVVGFDIPDLIVGQPYQIQLTAINNPTAFAVKGLPRGLTFDSKTLLIRGRPQVVSPLVTVEIIASNKAGKSEKTTDTFAVTSLATGVGGSFTGPLGRDASINGILGGLIKFQVTSTGALSGTVTLGGKAHKVAALLDTSLESPEASFSLPRPGQTALTVSLHVYAAAKAIYGEITDGTTVLPFIARQPLTPAGAYAGDYTLAMLLDEPDVGDVSLPQGASIGAFKIAPTGAATGVIILADSTKLTFGGPLEQNGHLTVFGVLSKGVGSLLGAFDIEAPSTVGENSTTTGNLAVSEFSWFKGEVAKDRAYAEGFGPLDLQVIGRKYSAPASDELALGAQAGPGNAKISFTDGGAPDPVTRMDLDSIEIGLKTTKITEPNPAKIKLTVVAGAPGKFTPGTSGSFKGSLELTDTDTTVTPNKPLKRSASFQGMIVDDGESLKGYGFFLLPQMPSLSPLTTAKTSPIFSGGVWLEAVHNIE